MSTPTHYDDNDDKSETVAKNNVSSNGGGGGSTSTTTTTQITLQVNTDMTAAQRFPTWILLCVSSMICVIALQSRRGLLNVDDGGSEAWILSVSAISFILSFAAVVMYLCFRTVFVSNIPEAVMVRFCCCYVVVVNIHCVFRPVAFVLIWNTHPDFFFLLLLLDTQN